MDRQELRVFADSMVRGAPENRVSPEAALRPGLAGMRIFDEPLIGFGAAGDPLFVEYKKTGVIGPWFMAPREWLEGAGTVISFFFPFTETVRRSNLPGDPEPSFEWLHARIEGEAFLRFFAARCAAAFEREGVSAAAPGIDPRFNTSSGRPLQGHPEAGEAPYTSNWSERHAAFACGLGTFSLSKGLITEKGVAGRFTSLITTALFEPDSRPYTDIQEYCILCGKCAENCPARAITAENGKSHPPCSRLLHQSREKYMPRYGCGKCQCGVPCEAGIPRQL